MKFIEKHADTWQRHVDGEAPADHRILTLAQWEREGAAWPADFQVGLALANTDEPEVLRPVVRRLALVALEFPKWTDGRAYSQAHLLRVRLRFTGEVRAIGDVTVDMAALLHRSGFDAAVLREGQNVAYAKRALEFFGFGHYQGDVIEARPAFARRAA